MGVTVGILVLLPALAAVHVLSWDNLDFQLHLAIAETFKPYVGAAHIAHKVEGVRLQPLAQPLIYESDRNGKLRKEVNAHPGRAQLRDKAAVHVEDETLPHLVARIAVTRFDDLGDDGV